MKFTNLMFPENIETLYPDFYNKCKNIFNVFVSDIELSLSYVDVKNTKDKLV